MPTSPPPNDDARALFAAFLERLHEHGADLEQLCTAHPVHRELFRRWWRSLESSGEVETKPAADQSPRFGPYVLLEELGRGAQGTVHLAQDTRTPRRVALKILPPHRGVFGPTRQRFLREAEAAARLDHPGICTVFETGVHDERLFIAMRFVEGETLAQTIAQAQLRREPLAIDVALPQIEAVAGALHAAHEAGLIHRDVKPGNIMASRAGQPVLLDFGLARTDDDAGELTRSGELVGTPAYMAPEQIAGQRDSIDRRADVYGLGATLFESLTLQRPFSAPTQEGLFQRILTAPLPDPRALNPRIGHDLALVLRTALARDRRERYATAADFAEDLRRVRCREPILARSVPALRRLGRWASSNRALAASLALAGASLLAGTIVSLTLWLRARESQLAYEGLADDARLRDALREEEQLSPPHPDLLPRLQAWLDAKARPLAARLPEHRARLANLRASALPYSPDDAAADRARDPARARLEALREQIEWLRPITERLRGNGSWRAQAKLTAWEQEAAEVAQQVGTRVTYRYPKKETEFLHDALHQLVRDLEHLTASDGAIARVDTRIELARGFAQRLAADAAAWRTADETTSTSERYGRRRLAPQVGLTPLGPDPSSGLLEFAELRSGTPPTRDPETGRLRLGPESSIVFALVPGGHARIGAQSRDPSAPRYDGAAEPLESPLAETDLEWFFIGKFELSTDQWLRLAEAELMIASNIDSGRESMRPVTQVSWRQTMALLARCGMNLPTEMQWEYAARAGTETPMWFGRDPAQAIGKVNWNDGRRRNPTVDDGFDGLAPVDSLVGNGFGLHHVAGNVAEWCRDHVDLGGPGESKYRAGDGERLVTNSQGRIVRGGSFQSSLRECRSSARGGRSADTPLPVVGVRPVRRVEP